VTAPAPIATSINGNLRILTPTSRMIYLLRGRSQTATSDVSQVRFPSSARAGRY